MKKWLIAFAIVALMALLSTPTTLAASRSHVSQGAASTGRAAGLLVQIHPYTSVISCSGYGCDDVYAYPQPSNVDGSNCGGSWLGWLSGEPQWSKMYYSSSCSTNFAYVTSSPDGSALIEVLLQRRHGTAGNPVGWIQSDNPFYKNGCAGQVFIPPNEDDQYCDPDNIPSGAHSWITNMLYAPVDQVRVCVSTVNHPSSSAYCSAWH